MIVEDLLLAASLERFVGWLSLVFVFGSRLGKLCECGDTRLRAGGSSCFVVVRKSVEFSKQTLWRFFSKIPVPGEFGRSLKKPACFLDVALGYRLAGVLEQLFRFRLLPIFHGKIEDLRLHRVTAIGRSLGGGLGQG